MIGDDDLRAAIAAGIVDERQAAALTGLARARAGARRGLTLGDEPFELFRGFNEIFIVVGLIILAIGWSAVAGAILGGNAGAGGLIGRSASVTLANAVLIWALAEYFTRRRRMIAPSITLVIFWTVNALAGFSLKFGAPFMLMQQDYTSLPVPLALTTGAILVYWLRFRVPFALALIALGAFAVALVTAAAQAGQPAGLAELFLLSGDGPFAWITLAIGLVTFAAAMAFDMSDPHRVTRRASNGFWLHLVAAPALVNTVALSLLARPAPGADLTLMGVLLLFALVAIVIDRRSFLLAAVGYSVSLGFTLFGGEGAALVILALGATLLVLGAFWEPIRAALLRLLRPLLPLHRLPPSRAGVPE